MLSDRIARIAEKTHTDILYLLGMNENDKPVATKKIKPKAVRIPVVGMVQAGIPADAVTDPLDWEEVTPELAAKGDITCLQIRGSTPVCSTIGKPLNMLISAAFLFSTHVKKMPQMTPFDPPFLLPRDPPFTAP